MRERYGRVMTLLSSLLFVGSITPSFSQGSVTAAPQVLPASSPGAGSGISVLDKIVDRSGGIASIGIINQTNSDAVLAGTALLCNAKGVPSISNADADDSWLFGVPLWHPVQGSTIRPGPNVFDLSVQGYEIQKPDGAESKRHFNYVFKMIRTRTLDLAASIPDAPRATDLRRRGLEFARALAGASENDVPSQFQKLQSFDDFLNCRIRVRALTSTGVVETTGVAVNAIGLILWLANYVRSENFQEIEQFAHAIE